jgi:hypothetical protein
VVIDVHAIRPERGGGIRGRDKLAESRLRRSFALSRRKRWSAVAKHLSTSSWRLKCS